MRGSLRKLFVVGVLYAAVQVTAPPSVDAYHVCYGAWCCDNDWYWCAENCVDSWGSCDVVCRDLYPGGGEQLDQCYNQCYQGYGSCLQNCDDRYYHCSYYE
jgi:hypothetical protein